MARKKWTGLILLGLVVIALVVWGSREVAIRAAEIRSTQDLVPIETSSTLGRPAVAPSPVSGTPALDFSTPVVAQVMETPSPTPLLTATPVQSVGIATIVPTVESTLTASLSPTTEPILTTPSDLGTVGGAALNLREGPATEYSILRTLDAGTTFTVLGQDASGNWLFVLLSGGQTGWLDRSFTAYTATAAVVAAPPLPPAATPAPTTQPGASSPPTIQLLDPAAYSTFVTGQQVTVESVAADSSGVNQIRLLVDNVPVQSASGSAGQQILQASLQWQATMPGSHIITVIATDFSGSSSQPASVVVNVASSGSGPVAQIVQPSGTIVIQAGQEVVIQSTATADSGVTRMELWADGGLYSTAYSGNTGGQSPFSVSQSWSSTVIGEHTLFVSAYDSLGQSTDTGSITIGVADTNPPQISASISATTVTVGDQVIVHTSASDSKGITSIELWIDGVPMEVARSSSPVGQSVMEVDQTWEADMVGPHTLFVVARDSVGKSTQSDSMNVTVLPVSTLTPVPTVTPMPTTTPVPTATPSPTSTPAPSSTPTPTQTPMPTAMPTTTPAPTSSPTPTEAPVPTATPVPTNTPTPAPTQTPIPTQTPARTSSPTPTVTPVPTATLVPTNTPTPAPTQTPMPTGTPAPTSSPTPTEAPAPTAKPVPTRTPTPAPTQTAIPAATATPTATPVR